MPFFYKSTLGKIKGNHTLTKINIIYDYVEITILHLWIHSLTYVLRIAVHLRCGHLLYDETAEVKADCDRALREIQQVRFH